ncbi:MAG TPA: alpha/beta hydrolase [Phototrophicaceae bacterium]|nr:alpha/beta hydrolase [Phototrophicaceae bacterium]
MSSDTMPTIQAISKDGATIGCYVLGSGPGLLIVHGGGGRATDYRALAQQLADSFTIYLLDRRGRGLSSPQGDDYRIEQEYSDVIAVLERTGCKLVFAHSYGGSVALGAARLYPIDKLALYEPALSIGEPLISDEKVASIRAPLERGDQLGALRAWLQGSDLAAAFGLTDEQLMAHFAALAHANTRDWQNLAEVLPTLIHEGKAANLLTDVQPYANISANTLLIQGEQTGEPLQAPIRALESVLPHVHTVYLPGQGHSGGTDLLGTILKQFFET